MADQRLTTLAKRLRPFILGYAQAAGSAGSLYNPNRIILYPSTTANATIYVKSDANLTAALLAATAGDVVIVNGPFAFSGNFSVPADVVLGGISRSEVSIAGAVTMGDGALLYNLEVIKIANDANTIYAVQNSLTGMSYIYYCNLLATQSGAGNAYAIYAANGIDTGDGDMEIYHSYLNGDSSSGDGYAVYSSAGEVTIWHSICYGSTDRFYEVP